MIPTRIAALAAILLALTVSQAEARKSPQSQSNVTCFKGDRVIDCGGRTSIKNASRHQSSKQAAKAHRNASNEAYVASNQDYSGETMLPHPAGCPHRAFCACGAAVEVFGSPIRALWPSTAWFKYPRSAPGYKMVAVRHGHVFVLRSHIQGDIWLVADYNSGGHQSRLHARSIKGYTIVNPHGSVALK